MKNIHIKLIVLLITFLSIPFLNSAQDSLTFELRYEVNRNYPPVSITKEKLTQANTVIDLNKNYHSSWIKEYISVQVRTSNKGRVRNAVSKNDTLSQEQKDIMNMADPGTNITVKVRYIPDNNLTHNDIKEITFTFTVDPENEASFPGGQQQLKQYLKDNAIDNISEDSFKKYQLTAVKFTIDEQGQIIDAHVFESSKDEKVDKILLEAIRNMPRWKPAQYAKGFKVKQEFVFTVGDMESCMINLLNIRQLDE